MHKTRINSNKILPITRKGTKYIVVPSHSHEAGIPLLLLMRDLLKIVKTRKELKKILHEKKVQVNGKDVKEESLSLLLFDTLAIKPDNKNYRVIYSENKKFGVEEIDDKEANFKVTKLIGKKIIKGNKIQLNFIDGRNIISSEKINIGDSVLINLKNEKIEKIMPVKEGANAFVIKGKHLGNYGKIEKIDGKKILIKVNNRELEIQNKEIIII